MGNRWGNSGNSGWLYFGELQNHFRWWLQPWNEKTLTPWKESYDQPRQHIKKQRHYFVNKGPSSQGYGFPVVMYGYESWTIRRTEWQRIDAFELWCWTRLLRVPWTARRSNQSILEEISPGCSWRDWCWSWNSNILATWWKELIHCKSPWCWEGLRADGERGDRGWDGGMVSPTERTWSLSKLWAIMKDEILAYAVHEVTTSCIQLSSRTAISSNMRAAGFLHTYQHLFLSFGF